MIVYCDCIECKNNKGGQCDNRFPSGEEAIKVHLNWFVLSPICALSPICIDFEEAEGE